MRGTSCDKSAAAVHGAFLSRRSGGPLAAVVLLVAIAVPPSPAVAGGDLPAQMPEACAVDRGYAARRATETARLTREVTALLPRTTGPLVETAPASKIATTADNVIDREIFATLTARGVQPAADATDAEFCRRVYLDLTGTQPPPARLLAYVASTDPNKKEALVDELLASPAYVDRWANWWGDLLRNRVQGGTDFLPNRTVTYRNIREAVARNETADRIVTDALTFTGRYDKGLSSYLPLIVYQVDFPQDRFDEMAAETSRAFLGTSIACISCHDGAGHLESINLYLAGKKRKEFWGIAAFFAQVEIQRIENSFDIGDAHNVVRRPEWSYIANTQGAGMRPPRTGGTIKPSFKLFGKGKPKGGEEPRVALARVMTAHPQFARNIVNRLWAHFFTVGLVEPLDGFDLARLDPNVQLPVGWTVQPSHPTLLADLGTWFQTNQFDMRALMKLMVLSRAYGLSSRYDEAAWREEYVRLFARKLPRRLMAEEALDAVAAATRYPGDYRALGLSETIRTTMALPDPTEPAWRWDADPGSPNSPGEVRAFLQTFGRGDRWVKVRSPRTTIGQALELFNGWTVWGRIDSNTGLAAQLGPELVARRITAEQAIETVYLETLARRPSAAELTDLAPRIRDRNSLADLQWALLNRVDFLYNY